KGPVPCVDTFMDAEITGCSESLIAPVKVTGKRPAPCVDAFVFAPVRLTAPYGIFFYTQF
ncbi:hypothetical protein, partial [Sansalvadorimonas verongulae]|uniref:hypothetical protein n=1 Tax=Sansalvadorimonas verongulae TaxID=2172824 RepID=UPI001E51816F